MTALRETNGEPERLPEPLAIRYRHNLAQNIVKEKAFFSVSNHLKERGLHPIPIKGMYLVQTLYRDLPGIRPMVDIDLLVSLADFRKLPALIRENPAWHPVMERWLEMRSFLAADIAFVTEHTTVEIKRNLLLVPLVDFRPVFDEAETVFVSGMPVAVPRFAHALLLCLLHHIGDLLHYRRIEPRHLAEFSVMLASFGDIAVFRETCRAFRVERWYDLMLFLLYTFFEHPVVTPADFIIHPVFSRIERKGQGLLGCERTFPLLFFLYRKRVFPLLFRNAALFFPKKILHR